ALSEFDSMGFLRDSAYGDLLVLYPRRNPPFFIYSLSKTRGLDSITFVTYQYDTNVIVFSQLYHFWDSTDFGWRRDSGYGKYFSSYWKGNRIYTSSPGRFFDLDSGLHIVQDSSFYGWKGNNHGPLDWSLDIND